MPRYYIDCRGFPGNVKCTVAISADTKEELLEATIQHGTKVHGYNDTPEFREKIAKEFKEGTPPAVESWPVACRERNMRRSNETTLWLFLLCSFILASQPTHADVVTDWNVTTITATPSSALPQTRALAIVHGAIFDAVNSINRRYTSYAVDLKAPLGASLEAAEAHGVLSKLYPAAQQANFDAALNASLAKIALARSLGIRGVALFKLDGNTDPALWPLLK